MGLIQAAVGAIGGTLADQWKDFFTVPDGLAVKLGGYNASLSVDPGSSGVTFVGVGEAEGIAFYFGWYCCQD